MACDAPHCASLPFPPPSPPQDEAEFPSSLQLLGLWTFRDDRKRYLPSNGSVSSLASIGAAHRLTFIFGSISTAVFFILSLVTERFLRTTRVLTEAREERYLWVAVGCADVLVGILAGASLILLAVFDTVEFPHEHDVLLVRPSFSHRCSQV